MDETKKEISKKGQEQNKRMSEAFYFLKKNNKMTQDEFSKKAGIGIGVLKNILYSYTEPNDLYFRLLCNAHSINLEWVMTGEGEMFYALSRDEKLAYMLKEFLANNDSIIKRAIIEFVITAPDEMFSSFEDFIIEKIKEDETTGHQE